MSPWQCLPPIFLPQQLVPIRGEEPVAGEQSKGLMSIVSCPALGFLQPALVQPCMGHDAMALHSPIAGGAYG